MSLPVILHRSGHRRCAEYYGSYIYGRLAWNAFARIYKSPPILTLSDEPWRLHWSRICGRGFKYLRVIHFVQLVPYDEVKKPSASILDSLL